MYNYEKEQKNMDKFTVKIKNLSEGVKKTPFKIAPYEIVMAGDNGSVAYRFRTHTDNLRYFIKQYICKGIKDYNNNANKKGYDEIPLNENEIIIINKPFGYVDIDEPLDLIDKRNLLEFMRNPNKRKRTKGVYAPLLLVLPMSYQKNYRPNKQIGDPIFSSMDYDLNRTGKDVVLYKPIENIVMNLMYTDNDIYKGKLAISKDGDKRYRLTDIFHINKNTKTYKILRRLVKPSVMRIGNTDRIVVLLDIDKVLKAFVSQIGLQGDIYNMIATESQNKDDNGVISYKYEFTVSASDYVMNNKNNKGYSNYIKARDLNNITKAR